MMNNSSIRTSAQSRMKHRKVLGVGECTSGHVPRSKIVQLLGNDHLNHIVIEQGDYPIGLRYFQWFTCLFFGVVGLVNVSYPQHFYTTVTPDQMDPAALARQVADDLRSWRSEGHELIQETSFLQLEKHFSDLERSLDMLDVPVRLYGVACLSLSALFLIVSIINTDNRRAIRIALFVEAMYFVIGILVTVIMMDPLDLQNTSSLVDPTSLFWLTTYKVIGLLLCMYYFFKTKPSRKN